MNNPIIALRRLQTQFAECNAEITELNTRTAVLQEKRDRLIICIQATLHAAKQEDLGGCIERCLAFITEYQNGKKT